MSEFQLVESAAGEDLVDEVEVIVAVPVGEAITTTVIADTTCGNT